MPKLREMSAGYLKAGQEFFLTSDGMFRGVFVDWHGFGRRIERDPVTGEPTGRTLRTVIYTCELGYRDEIPLDFPVYVKG